MGSDSMVVSLMDSQHGSTSHSRGARDDMYSAAEATGFEQSEGALQRRVLEDHGDNLSLIRAPTLSSLISQPSADNALINIGQDFASDLELSQTSGFGKALWLEAYNLLPPSEIKFLPKQSLDSDEVFGSLLAEINEKKKEMEKRQLSFTRKSGEKVPVRRLVDNISQYLLKFQAIGDVVVQYDPVHAALPWAGVRLLLQLVINDSQVYCSMLEGLEYVSNVIAEYSEAALFQLAGPFANADPLRGHLRQLYAAVLRYFNEGYHFYSQHRTVDAIEVEEDRVHKVLVLAQQEYAKRGFAHGLAHGFSSLQADIRSIHKAISEAPRKSTADSRKEILDWLKPTHTDDELDNAVRKRLTGTCDWYITNSSFVEWCDPGLGTPEALPKVLWIHSPPAFGKTVLSARLVQHLRDVSDNTVAFFFCSSSNDKKNKPYAILSSWIAQIIKSNDKTPEVVGDAYKKHQDSRERDPTTTELWKLFDVVSKVVSPGLVLAIDGFDECTSLDPADKFGTEDIRIQFLKELLQALPPTARLLITSRFQPSFVTELRSASTDKRIDFHEHKITEEDNQGDIKKLSTSLICGKLSNKPEDLRNEIVDKAAQKSRRMFLMLNLFGSTLKSSKNAKALRAAVEEMPAGINAAYQPYLDVITALKTDERDRVLLMLRLVISATRPMTVRELIEAIAVGTDDSADYPTDLLPDSWDTGKLDEAEVAETIPEQCASFLELRRSNDEDDVGSKTVHIVHESVREFLMGQPIITKSEEAPQMKGHEWLALLCLRYLCFEMFEDLKLDVEAIPEDLRKRFPFYEYAARNWTTHAMELRNRSSEVIEAATALLNAERTTWSHWRNYAFRTTDIFALDRTFDCEIQNKPDWQRNKQYKTIHEPPKVPPEPATPLYVAAIHGLSDVVGNLIKNGQDPEALSGSFAYPLQAAVAWNELETIRFLVGHGVDVNRLQEGYCSALHVACYSGLEETALYLLEKGADIGTLSPRRRTALHFACHSGSKVLVEKLLELGADWDHPSITGETPIARACASGHLDIVKLLLDRYGGEIPCHHGGWDLLRIAAYHRRYDIIRHLVANGADVNFNESGNEEDTPIHEASASATPEIVDLLLTQSNEKVSKPSDHRGKWTPIAYTLLLNSEPTGTLEVLFKHGANIDHCDNEGTPTLRMITRHIWSQNNPHYYSSKSLALCISKGMKFNVAAQGFSSPVLDMITRGDYALFQLQSLLKEGADVAAEEQLTECSIIGMLISSSVIHWREALSLLVDHGADINFQSDVFASPLHAAILTQNDEKIDTILDRGADVNAVWNNYTPMYIATERNDLTTIKKLLERGADINFCNNAKYIALRQAINNCNLDIVQYLVDEGASLKPLIRRSNDPLSASLYNNGQKDALAIFTILADRVDDVRTVDFEGDSALTEILFFGKKLSEPAYANVLIDNGAFLPKSVPNTSKHPFSRDILVLEKHAFNGEVEDLFKLYEQRDGIFTSDELDSILLAAAAGTAPRIVDKLVDNGASVDCQTPSGRTPLHLAVSRGNMHVVQTLLQLGASPHAKDDLGTSVIGQAARSPNQALENLHALIDLDAFGGGDLCGDTETWGLLVGKWEGNLVSTSERCKLFNGKYNIHVKSIDVRTNDRPARFEGTGEERGDKGPVVGQLFADHKVLFVLPCEANEGTTYYGHLDVENKTMSGKYGVNSKLIDGTFSIQKVIELETDNMENLAAAAARSPDTNEDKNDPDKNDTETT